MKPSAGDNAQVHLNISDGKQQAQRMLPALAQNYFQVADMRFHTLLSMMVDYAQAMKFYNLDNKEDGTWEQYFSVDETVVISTILATDAKKICSTLNYQFYKVSVDSQWLTQALCRNFSEEINAQIVSAYTVSKLLDSWYVALCAAQNDVGIELCRLIQSVIVGLEKELRLLQQLFAKFLPEKPIEEIFSPEFIALGWAEGEFTEFDEDFVVDRMAVRSNYYSFMTAIEMVQTSAANLLSASLEHKSHDPAVGLLIAFLQLFQKINCKINRFTHQYVDFYYEQVLRNKPRRLAPDSTYLIVKLNKKKAKVRIPKGTEFLAGLDEHKQNIVFTADNELLVNDAQVSALHTLFFNRDHVSSPENNLKESVKRPGTQKPLVRQFATSCWLNEIPVLVDDDADDQAKWQSYPLMGAAKDGEETEQMIDARLGFALASKVLLLSEGQRTICFTMKFDQAASEDGRTLEQWIGKISEALGIELVDDGDETAYAKEQDVFFKVFRNIFTISLSTETGWLEISDFLPSYSGVDGELEDSCLTITFSLPASAAPITPYSSAIHGEAYETQLPVAKFIVNPKGYLYPYGILSKLVFASVKIDVMVEGCRTLSLHNNIGPLSASAAFSPFGPMPVIGDYFIVGSPEAAGKHLESFDVTVKWSGLPVGVGGFKSYYQHYDKPLVHEDILINCAVLVEGEWISENAEGQINGQLFQLKSKYEAGREISHSSTLSCQQLMPYFSPVDYPSMTTKFNYTPSSQKGFFKFTLISPTGAFGHRSYPNVLAKVLTENARQKNIKKIKEVPNSPYTPVINSISVDYKASSQLVVGSEEKNCPLEMCDQLIHLHPLGWDSSLLDADHLVPVLPYYEFSGNLFIGLDASKLDGVLTLFFHLRENSLPIANDQFNELQWFYLSANQWQALNGKLKVLDTSQGFMTSGIVTLSIPADITSDNTIMPNGLFWLSVSANTNLDKLCSAYSVYTQAIQVTRCLQERQPEWRTIVLPAGRITRPKKAIPGLGSIVQLQESFGGVPSETREHLRARVSGRLKHKNRALIPADYEMLILEQFPQIYKVKCFANMVPEEMPEKRLRPGHILIVALPFLTQQEMSDHIPMLSGHLVKEIKAFIVRLAPPFVTINIINPVYELAQVRCTVKLKDGLNGGIHINHLNQLISDFLSPWDDTIGYHTHFGWHVSEHDIESYIQQLDMIDRVTDFSMLHIAPMGEDRFDLYDSASVLNDGWDDKSLVPKYPWSILMPIKQHFIEVDDRYQSIEPEITGVGELEIGSTFIISEEKWREKIEKP